MDTRRGPISIICRLKITYISTDVVSIAGGNSWYVCTQQCCQPQVEQEPQEEEEEEDPTDWDSRGSSSSDKERDSDDGITSGGEHLMTQ